MQLQEERVHFGSKLLQRESEAIRASTHLSHDLEIDVKELDLSDLPRSNLIDGRTLSFGCCS